MYPEVLNEWRLRRTCEVVHDDDRGGETDYDRDQVEDSEHLLSPISERPECGFGRAAREELLGEFRFVVI